MNNESRIEAILEQVRMGGWYDANPNDRDIDGWLDTDVAATRIKALIQEAAVAARIDELNHVDFDQVQDDVMYIYDNGTECFIYDRIKELEAKS